jgi:hypothetical protein
MVNEIFLLKKGEMTKIIVFKSLAVFILVLAIILFIKLIFIYEDDWIKDDRGVYIKHGNPISIPEYVVEQQDIVSSAVQLYNSKKQMGMEFSSQCIGTIRGYAIDIVNVPRSAEDDKPENQCEDFRLGNVGHFIELDKSGNIVRIV